MDKINLQVGQQVGAYQILARLGKGASGVVFRAHQLAVNREVAIKAIRTDLVSDPAFLARFSDEAYLVARLEHPHIVPLYDFWADDQGAFLIMRLMRGGSLAESLAHSPRSIARSLRLLEQICNALDFVHDAGIIHQDIKPANIMLDERGESYLADFGIARDNFYQSVGEGGFAGTPFYAAPEQLQGQSLSARTDLYALALVAFELFSGYNPLVTESIQDVIRIKQSDSLFTDTNLNSDLPSNLKSLLRRAVARNPDQRFESAGAFFEALQDVFKVKSEIPSFSSLATQVHFPAFLDPGPTSTLPTFIERRDALERLETLLKKTINGEGQIAFIQGSAGRGKTALVRHFIQTTAAVLPDLLVLPGFCNAFSGVGDPYLPFREILAALSGEVEVHLASGVISHLQARNLWAGIPDFLAELFQHSPDLLDRLIISRSLAARAARALPDHRHLLGRLSESSPSHDIGQQAIFEQVTRLLAAIAEHHPLLIWLDDLHWVDESSAGLLFHLGRRLTQFPIMVIGTYRLDEITQPLAGDKHPMQSILAEFKRSYGDITIDLGQSDELHGRGFVDALIDRHPNSLSEEFRIALHQHTGGHPLFTIELLSSLRDSGALAQDSEQRLFQTGPIEWQELPPRIEAVIETRIDRLNDDSLEILSVASVIGDEFIAQVIAQVQDINERRLLRNLSKNLQQRHRLIREMGEISVGGRYINRFRFAHVLFQQYLYDHLSNGERRLLHGEIAGVLENIFSEDVTRITVQLAYHFSQGGQVEKAVEYLLLAGKRAHKNFALQQAVEYFSQALQISDDPLYQRKALALRAPVYLDLYQGQSAANDFQSLLNFARQDRDPGSEFEALLGYARANNILAYNTNQLPVARLALESFQAALTFAEDMQDKYSIARVIVHMVWLADFFAEVRLRMPVLARRALQLSQEIDDEYLALKSQTITGWSNTFDGNLNESLRLCELAMQKLEKRGDFVLQRDAYFYMMIQHDFAGNFERSIACADAAIEIAEKLGVEPVQYYSYRANPLSATVQFRESWESLSSESFIPDFAMGEVVQLEAKSNWYHRALDHKKAMEASYAAYSLSVALNRIWIIDIVLPFWIQNSIWAGLYQSDQMNLYQAEMARVGLQPGPIPLIEVAIHEGKFQKALEMAEFGLQKEKKRHALKYYLDILEQKGRALMGAGQHDAAAQVADEGIGLASKLNYMSSLWRLWDTFALAKQHLGDHSGAEDAFQAAKALLLYLSTNLPDKNSKEVFFNSPLLHRYKF